MASACATGRLWAAVQCVCKHGAGQHSGEAAGFGCMAPSKDGSHDACPCMLDREDVLFAGTQRAIAEVCEHRAQQRARHEHAS